MEVDSLGGLRFLAHADSTLADTVAIVPDSIAGSLTLARGVLTGTMDTLTVRGSARANTVYFNKYSAESATLDFDLHDLPKSLAGSISFHADTATVAGIVLDSIRGVLGFSDLTHAHFDIGAASRNGPTAAATGDWLSVNGANEVRLATMGLGIGESLWSLTSPTRLTIDSGAIRLDSLLLRNRDSASVSMRGFVPDSGGVAGEVCVAYSSERSQRPGAAARHAARSRRPERDPFRDQARPGHRRRRDFVVDQMGRDRNRSRDGDRRIPQFQTQGRRRRRRQGTDCDKGKSISTDQPLAVQREVGHGYAERLSHSRKRRPLDRSTIVWHGERGGRRTPRGYRTADRECQ
jgi:hypothetical protein